MREKKNIIAGKTSVTTWRMIYIYAGPALCIFAVIGWL